MKWDLGSFARRFGLRFQNGDGGDGSGDGSTGFGASDAGGFGAAAAGYGFGFGSGMGGIGSAGEAAGIGASTTGGFGYGSDGFGFGPTGPATNGLGGMTGFSVSGYSPSDSGYSPGSQAAMGEAATMGLGNEGSLGSLGWADPPGTVFGQPYGQSQAYSLASAGPYGVAGEFGPGNANRGGTASATQGQSNYGASESTNSYGPSGQYGMYGQFGTLGAANMGFPAAGLAYGQNGLYGSAFGAPPGSSIGTATIGFNPFGHLGQEAGAGAPGGTIGYAAGDPQGLGPTYGMSDPGDPTHGYVFGPAQAEAIANARNPMATALSFMNPGTRMASPPPSTPSFNQQFANHATQGQGNYGVSSMGGANPTGGPGAGVSGFAGRAGPAVVGRY